MKAYVSGHDRICISCFETADIDDELVDGPKPHGGGEADYPQYCSMCGRFLENPLTDDGQKMIDKLSESHPKYDEWTDFYG